MARGAQERLKASAGVAALHALLAYALIAGFSVRVPMPASERLRLFHVSEPPPPPPEPPAKAAPEPEGASAPAGPDARPSPIVAPPAKLPVLSPISAAPEPAPLPTGTAPSAGAAADGTGTGAGGEGTGAGSGGRGSGSGGGGGVRAERVGGRISGITDYPNAARRAGIEGSVGVRYVVGTDGRAGGCRVIRSSGNAELDFTTCRLVEERFRYRPARDASGRPVPETVSRMFDWLLPSRR